MPDAATPFTTASIRFQTSGLIPRKSEPARQLWLNAWNDVLELRAFAMPPDIPVKLSDPQGLPAFYQSGAKTQNADVVDLELRDVNRVRAIWLVLQQPAKPTGTQFVGSVTLPYRNGSFVFKTQAIEVMTDRSSLEAAQDEAFPDHALSRVRRTLHGFIETVVLDAALEHEPKFGPEKPWWKVW